MRRTLSLLLVALCAFTTVWSQEDAVPLQAGFRTLELGMSMAAAKEQLTQDSIFDYRGEPDVSFLPITQAPVIQTAGTAFLERAVLQFDADRLYSITLVLDKTRLDYYSVYTSLSTKYGPPNELDPEAAVWRSDVVRLSVERPLTVKYLDAARFAELQDQYSAEESLEAISRERFLEQL